ncbi:MAG: transposase [Lacipirellulaceae bacterium]
MPCYLFTYHAHGSWMPDRTQGYVHRKEGVKPSDEEMARAYRQNQISPTAYFDSLIQTSLIEAARGACRHLDARCHAVVTETTHVHILISWKSERSATSMSRSLKSALSRYLNQQFQQRQWLSKGASKQPVKDLEHYEYLVGVYLPKHRGVQWLEDRTNR